MTDKRPGARDISDLKAKLGLAKGASRKPGIGGEVAPPPGMAPANVPAPPGVGAPFQNVHSAGSSAQIPNQQEVIVIKEGESVAGVQKNKQWQRIGKLVAMGLLPLIFGLFIGAVKAQNGAYNAGLDDADNLATQVRTARTQLQTIQNSLLDNKSKGKGTFLVPDKELTDTLISLSNQLPEHQQWKQIYATPLRGAVAQGTFDFFNEISRVRSLLVDHTKQSKLDDKQLPADVAKKLSIARRLAIVYAGKSGGGAAKLVEIGGFICPGGAVSGRPCPGGKMAGFTVRESRKDGFGKRDLFQGDSADSALPNGKLVPLASTGVLRDALIGAKNSVTNEAYKARLEQLDKLVESLIQRATNIDKALTAESRKSRKFTFFL